MAESLNFVEKRQAYRSASRHDPAVYRDRGSSSVNQEGKLAAAMTSNK